MTTQNLPIERYRADLVSGRVFALAEISHRSRSGYEPPTTRQAWSQAVVTLGKMAAVSDPLAQIAQVIIGRLNLYGTNSHLVASAYMGASKAIDEGYTDVIRRSGPEPGRRSDHHRPYSLAECAQAAAWLAYAFETSTLGSLKGLGWALAQVLREEGVPHYSLPAEAAAALQS